MPFFTVGFALCTLAYKTVRTLLKPYFTEEDSTARTEESSATVSHVRNTDTEEQHTTSPVRKWYTDPCTHICKFSNHFNNCWLNATLQATLNLKVVQEKLRHQTLETVTLPSTIPPEFANLFLTALQKPGNIFNAGEILTVMTELSRKVPVLIVNQNNDCLDLIDPLLCWFNQCGIQTTIQVKDVSKCEICDFTMSTTSSLGQIYFLPPPEECETIFSLFKRAIHDSQSQENCTACGSTSETQKVWTCPDILTLYLPRVTHEGRVLRKPVTPSELIEIPVDQNRTQTYRLSSVISHRGCASDGHFWSYLIHNHITIKANDCQISITRKGRPADINVNGIIYMYELSI
ncbi:hypothetical protein PAMP_004725 [Pampus punctatissimus]